ncbi:protein of unknown function [Streptomyces murinus]|uniref:hypothetical protein n=1 Tax=Streptomyces murinus TaxID=33900 RepID=UPI003D679DF4
MFYAGCDWSDQWLDVAVLDRFGAVVGETRIVYSESPDLVARYREFLTPLGRRWRATVTGIEDVNILFARSLTASGMDVVHVDPPAPLVTAWPGGFPRRTVPMRG